MPLLQAILKEKKLAPVQVFQVDFDRQKDFLQEHNVRWQSTLIVFRGKDERGRSTGDVNPESIRALIEKGL